MGEQVFRFTAEDVWPEDDAPMPQSRRLEILRRMLPCESEDIYDGRPDVWGRDAAGRNRLKRDLDKLGVSGGHGLLWPPGEWGGRALTVEDGDAD